MASPTGVSGTSTLGNRRSRRTWGRGTHFAGIALSATDGHQEHKAQEHSPDSGAGEEDPSVEPRGGSLLADRSDGLGCHLGSSAAGRGALGGAGRVDKEGIVGGQQGIGLSRPRATKPGEAGLRLGQRHGAHQHGPVDVDLDPTQQVGDTKVRAVHHDRTGMATSTVPGRGVAGAPCGTSGSPKVTDTRSTSEPSAAAWSWTRSDGLGQPGGNQSFQDLEGAGGLRLPEPLPRRGP